MVANHPHILVVSPTFPYPLLSGGKIRVYNILRQLSRYYRVTLLSLAESGEGGHRDRRALSFLENLVVVPIQQERRSQIFRLLRNCHRWYMGIPAEVLVKRSPDMTCQMKKLLQENDFVAVQVEYVQGAQYVPDECWGSANVVLIAHDVSFVSQQRKAHVAQGVAKWFWLHETNCMKAYEKTYWKKCNRIVAMSETDRELISQFVSPQKVYVVPNGVDCTKAVPSLRKSDAPTLIFVGWMRHLPNRDALEWFLKEIWPLVRRENKEVLFQIVGKGLPAELIQLVKDSVNIEILGQVEDVREVVGKAWISVVPIRIGSGSRLKILESMALGTSVVSTSIGAEGLDVSDNEDIRLADTVEDFAGTVLSLLHDTSARANIASKAKLLVESKYDWRMIGEKAKAVLDL